MALQRSFFSLRPTNGFIEGTQAVSEHHATLLITDDDRDFRQSLAEALQRRGFHTLEAEDGEEAMELVRRQSIHAMMVDNHMPRLTGIELARRLQSGSVFVPWILMSARIDERVVAEAEELHADSVLSKPFSLARLTEVLQSLLKTHYGWDRR